ncbi:hypothetical protein ACM614_28575 [Streptomyces sp. 12297]|nr:hypothetical protein [Streptomyces sp. NBC_00239]
MTYYESVSGSRVGFEQQGREKQYPALRGIHADVLLFPMSAEHLRHPS